MEKSELMTVYQTERSDEQNTSTLIIAINTAVLAYLGVAIAFVGTTRNPRIPDWLLLGAALPPFLLLSYARFQGCASILRQSYLVVLEQKLSANAANAEDPNAADKWEHNCRFPGYTTLQRGLYKGLCRSNWPGVVAHWITDYLAPLAISLLLFAYFIFWLPSKINASAPVVVGYGTAYFLIIFVNACAVYQASKQKNLSTLRKIADETADSEKQRWLPVNRLKVPSK
ncbi:hypothetical protein [Streptomyces sp. NPDC051636]|uniref:hypothetical protein n=1 Tax=Streptomyces sp. NPDC051636 TaxID=3365663 RepID=UPI0037AA02AF